MARATLANHGHNIPITARVVAQLRSGWQEYLLRRRLKATIYTLYGLDDRTLSDIGLNRDEIESVVSTRGAERRQRISIGGFIPRG